MRGLWFALALATSAGCLRDTEFKCMTSADCTGSGGTCETTGYCSFSDTECADGQRYGAYSGPYSNQCVGGGMPQDDAGVDAPSDAPSTGNCPSTYMALPNAGTHLYNLTAGAANWATQRTRCEADGAYLAIPDNAAELMAITTAAAAADTWVGINDIDTETVFVTVKGTPAVYLPWAQGEPDNPGGQGGEDCVAAQMASPTIKTYRCSINTFPAVCECEP